MNTISGKIVASGSNLLCSDGGIALMPEICLRVVELLFESDPKSVGRLLLVSKSLFHLLVSCEKSMTKTISRKEHDFKTLNGLELRVIASRDRRKNNVLFRHTYPWLCEMYYRKEMSQFLINHKITEMVDIIDGWPSFDTSKEDVQTRIDMFRTQALSSLFRLSDCVAGLDSPGDIREEQTKFLYRLSTEELACLGVMIEVMGQNFFIMTKRSLLGTGLPKNDSWGSKFLQLISSFSNSLLTLPPLLSENTEDLNDYNWIRETMCIFEHLSLRYGPYFAWAYLEGLKDNMQSLETWALREIYQGFVNMHAFERGTPKSYASLQSVVWTAFRQKYGCGDIKSWNIAKSLVETEMIFYHTKDKLGI